MFLSHFLMTFMWFLSALRQMHHLKEKYFATILKQEQGWFDENNAYEFSTKVQAQLEQIELGVGDKFGVLINCIFYNFMEINFSYVSSYSFYYYFIFDYDENFKKFYYFIKKNL